METKDIIIGVIIGFLAMIAMRLYIDPTLLEVFKEDPYDKYILCPTEYADPTVDFDFTCYEEDGIIKKSPSSDEIIDLSDL